MALQIEYDVKLLSEEIAKLIGPLSKTQQESLAQQVSLHRYKKNEIIYKDSDRPQKMKCLINGKVKIFKEGVGGRRPILRVIKPIDFFGYRAYFANEDYKTAGMALETTDVLLIPMLFIEDLIKKNHHVSMFFIRHLSKELGASDQRTVNLTQKHIRGRLAGTLISLKNLYGISTEKSKALNIQLSREDLGLLSNMTTSNAIRTLSSFANDGIICIKGKNIQIINEEELIRISQNG